ncbi:hypothetical protein [Olleya sp. 1-3]|uniref:hypothetical protein n=1 Tax=Olleya sp. 1-3 TaxID=2058323 RepID=UPI000C34126B|nr:hypothetical protein [Olleya sp. 1-3]PKG52053.1 hypothetical protein CXF54_05730 [Olleya sp. 1-3]
MHYKIILNLILILTAGFSLQAQTITIKGKVLDSLQQPLQYANLLAVSVSEVCAVTFAIANQEGNYKS